MFYPMSTVESPLWIGEKGTIKSKYEKCQDITSEIYKRIDITFEIKRLESNVASDGTNEIDSNELSNGTDLFAYEKTDSLSSSVTLDDYSKPPRKIINLNNNEETLRPKSKRKTKKRFRKRIKKKLLNRVETDCSSDEEPLSRIVTDIRRLDESARQVVSVKKQKNAKKLIKIRKSKHKLLIKSGAQTPPTNSVDTVADSAADNANSDDEQMRTRKAREYDYFAKVMETVSDASDLDAVMLPALYPKVDLYEKKLGLTSDNITYYTFAGLLNEAAGTSNIKSASNYGPCASDAAPTPATDLVKIIPENLEGKNDYVSERDGPTTLSSLHCTNSIPNSESHFMLDTKSRADPGSKCCEGLNLQLRNCIDLSVQSFVDTNARQCAPLILESKCHLNVVQNLKSNEKLESCADGCHEVDLSEAGARCEAPETAEGGGGRPGGRQGEVGRREQCRLCKLSFSSDGRLRKHLERRCAAAPAGEGVGAEAASGAAGPAVLTAHACEGRGRRCGRRVCRKRETAALVQPQPFNYAVRRP